MLPGILQDAARLVYRMQTALKGESGGLETAMLAWRYAAAVQAAAERLDACAAATGDLEALLLEQASPPLLETLDALSFPEIDAWNQRCLRYRWTPAPALPQEKAVALRQALAQKADPKAALLAEYRKRARAKDPAKAYSLAQILARKFPDDASLQEEAARLRQLVGKQASEALSLAQQELMPDDSVKAVLTRYRENGYDFSEPSQAVKAALAIEQAEIDREAAARIQAVLDQSKKLLETGDWQTLEEPYCAADTYLAATGARATLDGSLRGAFSNLGANLARLRSAFESEISIHSTAQELNDLLKGKTAVPHRGKVIRDTAQRLASYLVQAKKTGVRLEPDLVAAANKAVAEARKRRLALLGGIALGGIAAIAAIAFLIAGQASQSSDQERVTSALAKLQAAQAASDPARIEALLDETETLARQAEPASPLAQQRKVSSDWIAAQWTLETEYAATVAQLDALKAGPFDSAKLGQANQIKARAKALRQELASSFGAASDAKLTAFDAWQSDAAKKADTHARSQIDELRIQLAERLEAAKAAPSETAFAAVQEAIGALRQAEEKAGLLATGDNSLVSQAAAAIEQLKGAAATLDTAKSQLAKAETLSQYLESVDRILALNTLSRPERLALERVAKAGPELRALKTKLILPDPEAQAAFAGADYRKTNVAPTPSERAFIERLANDDSFVGVYRSKVKYYEGDAIAKSEYAALVAEPVSKSTASGVSGISYGFLVRGFDEQGEPEAKASEMNFISQQDGSFWGFFYEPSEISAESLYYEEKLRLSLLQAAVGAPRFTLIGIIEQLNQETKLSPAFRAYWHQQLFALIKADPWKWGLPLSPALQSQAAASEKLAATGLAKTQWRSSIEQTVPSPNIESYFRGLPKASPTQEATAHATLVLKLLEGDFELAGQIDASGTPQPAPGKADSGERLWTLAQSTALPVLLGSQPPAPYAPILRYRRAGQPAKSALSETFLSTTLDLSQPPYADRLPPLLK